MDIAWGITIIDKMRLLSLLAKCLFIKKMELFSSTLKGHEDLKLVTPHTRTSTLSFVRIEHFDDIILF